MAKQRKVNKPKVAKTRTIVRYIPYSNGDDKYIRKYVKRRAQWPDNTEVGSNWIRGSMMTDSVYHALWFHTEDEAKRFVAYFGLDGVEVFRETFDNWLEARILEAN